MKLKNYVNLEEFLFIPTEDNICVFHNKAKNLLLDKWDYPERYKLRSQRDFTEYVDETFATVGGRYRRP